MGEWSILRNDLSIHYFELHLFEGCCDGNDERDDGMVSQGK